MYHLLLSILIKNTVAMLKKCILQIKIFKRLSILYQKILSILQFRYLYYILFIFNRLLILWQLFYPFCNLGICSTFIQVILNLNTHNCLQWKCHGWKFHQYLLYPHSSIVGLHFHSHHLKE